MSPEHAIEIYAAQRLSHANDNEAYEAGDFDQMAGIAITFKDTYGEMDFNSKAIELARQEFGQ